MSQYLLLDHDAGQARWLTRTPQGAVADSVLYTEVKQQRLHQPETDRLSLDGVQYRIEPRLVSDQTELLILDTAITDDKNTNTLNLEAFNLAFPVFELCQTEEEACLQCVKLLKDMVEIDRAGILLFRPSDQSIVGTWGTDEHGDIVSEQDLILSLKDNPQFEASLSAPGQLTVQDHVPLFSQSRRLGEGWNAVISIVHHREPLGWVCCDNLVSGREISHEIRSQITLVSNLLGHWLVRLRNENRLKALSDNLEAEVAKKTQALENTLHELKSTQDTLIRNERTKTLSTFTAGVAHEINNPISFIRSNLSFISKVSSNVLSSLEPIEDEALKQPTVLLKGIDQVIDESVGGLDRVSNIITMLQPLNKLADEKPQAFDLKQVIDFAINGLSENPATFRVEDSLEGQQVCLPIQAVTLAIENILENALLAVAEQSDPTIHISMQTDDTDLTIEIHDNGTGIPTDILSQVFMPFFTTRPPGSGMGLGLSLSQNLIQLADGQLSVESQEGEGSTFIIRFKKDIACTESHS